MAEIADRVESAASDEAIIGAFQEKCGRLLAAVEQVIIGQRTVIEHLLVALFARGHALLIGVPGLGKTLLVKTLAGALGWNFKRIQFTPDLMPSDITGVEILQTDAGSGERRLKFVKGPIFANLVLADEINRTPPKTQAALLEAMQEYSVTVSGQTLHLERPFTVVATQNPIEHEGTYRLPEAQLDRFMFSIAVDYPVRDKEVEIVEETTRNELPEVRPVFSKDEVMALQALVRQVPVSRHVLQYAVSLARASRPADAEADSYVKNYVEWGAGPRACQHLVLAAKVRALMNGKPAPSCQDVQAVTLPVFGHRIIPNYNATGEGVSARQIAEHLVKTVREPSYKG